jgi:hypothetical protein
MAKTQIIAVLSGKGGVGKSTISQNILPSIEKIESITEIDDNNMSSIYENSNIFKCIEVKNLKVKDGQKALTELSFEQMRATGGTHIIDAGGGNDTNYVIEQIAKADIENVIYIIPFQNSFEQIKNVEDTFERIKAINENPKVIFCLNQAKSTTIEEIKEEAIFWFGSKKYNISGLKKKLYNDNDSNNYFAYIANNIVIELAKSEKEVIGDTAQIARDFSLREAKKVFFDKYQNDMESYERALSKYWRAQDAKEYIDVHLSHFTQTLQQAIGENNE